MAPIQPSGTRVWVVWRWSPVVVCVRTVSDLGVVVLLRVCRQAKDVNSDLVVAVKNLRVGRDLESAKRALREVGMLKHFMGSENVRYVLLRKWPRKGDSGQFTTKGEARCWSLVGCGTRF